MAAPTLVTRDNFSTLIVRSTNPRGSGPNGNLYIDPAGDRVELITLAELGTVDLGGGLEANPLTEATKIQNLAIYFALLFYVEADPTLQQYRAALDAAPQRLGKLVGATSWLSGIKLASGAINVAGPGGSLGDDRLKVADSGFTEFAAAGGGNSLADRVYHGAKGVNNILGTSQPYYLLAASPSEADRQAAVPVDFAQLGQPNQVIQTFGDTGNGDAGAGDFDARTQALILMVRSFGQLHGETSNAAVGVDELGPYAQGYPLNEDVNSLVAGITEADVWGGAQIAPYTGLSFSRLAAPQTETGFNEADGDFTDIIANTGGATLAQVVAWLDKLSESDADENANTGVTGVFRPRRARTFYDVVNGIVVFRQGIFVENLPTSDQQSLRFIDDAGGTKTYPFQAEVIIALSAAWFADPAPWFRGLISDGAGAADFDTAGAVTALDAALVAVAGDQLDARIFAVAGGYELRFPWDYDGNVQAGLVAGTDRELVFQAGGLGTPGGTKRRTVTFTVTRSATIRIDATTEAETN